MSMSEEGISVARIIEWLAIAVIGLVQWIFSRETRAMDRHRDECDTHRNTLDGRLRSVEQQGATRADIHALREDITRGITDLRSDVREQVKLLIDSSNRGAR